MIHLLFIDRLAVLKVLLCTTIILLSYPAAFAKDAPVLNIFLVQNSGWMEPFYADSNSKFKNVVKDVIEKVNSEGEEIVIASFNQSIGENRSPLLAYRGKDAGDMVAALQSINLVKKPGSKSYADTDFKEAVVNSIMEYSPGRPCILWIFTNNKNSPGNNPKTAAKNMEFYTWLQDEENIKRIFAYTYPMPVNGRHYSANGMMIYAMAYGKPANNRLEKLRLTKLPFEDQPARLKPLNADAVTFVPTKAAKSGNFDAFIGSDKRTLIIQFDSSSRPEVAVINGVFRNDFFPYDIRSADVSINVKFRGEGHGILADINPRKLEAVSAGGESSVVAVKIATPPLPNMWSDPEIIFKSGYQVQAMMEFTLANQELMLSPDFLKRLNVLFPGDPLPEIFVPGESARQSITSRPLLVKVEYPVWPLIALALSLGLVVIGGLFFLTFIMKEKKFTVVVDGMQQTCMLKAFGECAIYSDKRQRIGTLKRKLGKPVVKLDEGCTAHISVV